MTSSFIEKDLQAAVEVLRKGGIIMYPTETIWGIGCDSGNSEAVKRVFQIKERSDAKAMISLVDSMDMLKIFLYELPPAAEKEISGSQRPVTVIFDTPKDVSPNLMAEDGSAAFRVTSLPFAQELCRRLGRPLVSTSANISGKPSPALFADIDDELISRVDYVCETGRDNPKGNPSRIIKITNAGRITVIRE